MVVKAILLLENLGHVSRSREARWLKHNTVYCVDVFLRMVPIKSEGPILVSNVTEKT